MSASVPHDPAPSSDDAPAQSRHRPHVLYVAWGFPPGRSGGVYRALATANALQAGGFRVTVLTVEREVFERYTGLDTSLEAEVHPDITVRRLPFAWPYMDRDPAEWGAFRRRFPRVWRKLRVQADRVLFPETLYGPWRSVLRRAALDIHASDPVDLVVATANPNVDFTVASLLFTRGVPYVMDYRDAWLLDVFSGSQVHSDRSRAARIERRLVAGATEVWFVNDPIRQWHEARYPEAAERMRTVANGFDPEYAPAARTAPAPPGRPLGYGYIGTVTAKVPMREFVEGWLAARRRGGVVADASAHIWGYLGFYNAPNTELLHLLERHADRGISYAGPLPKGELRSAYDNLDVLLLLLGSGAYVTSGKVYEYAASALPIVSVHPETNAASSLLRDYPLWFRARDSSPEAIADALEEAGAAARSAGPEVRAACAAFAAPYRRDLQLGRRIQELHDHVVGGRAAGRDDVS